MTPTRPHAACSEETISLNPCDACIGSVIWSAGFARDFGWVRFPILDNYGYPLQQGGVRDIPGRYFVGLPWLTKYKSGLPIGVRKDAERVAGAIGDSPAPPPHP